MAQYGLPKALCAPQKNEVGRGRIVDRPAAGTAIEIEQ
jgi:hypothetical protein